MFTRGYHGWLVVACGILPSGTLGDCYNPRESYINQLAQCFSSLKWELEWEKHRITWANQVELPEAKWFGRVNRANRGFATNLWLCSLGTSWQCIGLEEIISATHQFFCIFVLVFRVFFPEDHLSSLQKNTLLNVFRIPNSWRLY
jgi:hypothetical protein